MKLITFLIVIFSLSNGSSAKAQDIQLPVTQAVTQSACPSEELFSDITYEDLRKKLDTTLKEKNKSMTFLDFRGLQAQMDVLTNHLLVEDQLTSKEATAILKKTLAHMEQLNSLLIKAKESAKQIKEDQVVPLATLTSLKSEADACNLTASPYNDIFKILSRLNKELGEILMISQYKISAQKEKVSAMLSKVRSSDELAPVKNQEIAEHFNFIQKHIQYIVQTFEFDPRVLQIAKQ